MCTGNQDFTVAPRAGSATPTSSFAILCNMMPTAAYVTGINGSIGTQLNRIGPVTCSDGVTPVIRSNGTWVSTTGGGSGGTAWSHTSSPAGYKGITVQASTAIDRITLNPVYPGTPVSYGGTGGAELRCPDGFVLAGLYGQATATAVLSIGIFCRPIFFFQVTNAPSKGKCLALGKAAATK